MVKRKTLKQKQSLKVWSRVLIFLSTLGIILLGYIIFFSPLFIVSNLDFSLSNINCVDRKTLENDLNLKNKWIFKSNSDLEKIKQKYFCIKSIELKKDFPNKIKVSISPRQALVNLKSLKLEASNSGVASSSGLTRDRLLDFSRLESDTSFLIDNEGMVFSQKDDPSIPTLFLSNTNLSLGQQLGVSLVSNSISILKGLRVLNVSISVAKIQNDNLAVNSDPKLIFSLSKDVDLQLASLQLILEEAKMEDIAMEFVDLRFDNPIVKYSVKKKGESN